MTTEQGKTVAEEMVVWIGQNESVCAFVQIEFILRPNSVI